jgi:hypothetical protein
MHGANPEASQTVSLGVVATILKSALLDTPSTKECAAFGLEDRAPAVTGHDKGAIPPGCKATWLRLKSKTSVITGARAKKFYGAAFDIDPVEPAATLIPAWSFSQKAIAA